MKSSSVSSLRLLAALAASVSTVPLFYQPVYAGVSEATGQGTLAALIAESRLTAATVYPDRAVVTRLAKVALASGTSEVVFAGLPAGLMDESVQVSAKGSVAATLLDVSTRTVYVSAEPDARVKALEDKLVALRREERVLTDRAAVLESQRGLVAGIEKASTTPVSAAGGTTPPARPSLEEYAKLIAFSAEQRGRLNADAQQLDLERAALAEKIAAAESQLNEMRGKQGGRRATKVVTVRLAAPAAGAVDLSLAYALPGASWSSAYDARLRSAERQVLLDAFGLVRNATGEDWSGVVLTLSTARPALGGSAPEIGAWYVNVAFDRSAGRARLETANKVMGGFFNNNAMLAADAAPAPAAAVVEDKAAYAVAAVESAATSANFRIATPVTLASDNTPQRVPLGSAVFDATLQYQATPKLQETAFLAAYVTNTSELPFLGGALNVFLDDTFVATARLATTMPGEKLTLNLGADEGVSIKRKIVSRFTEDTGFTSKSRRTTYDILVTVTNNKRTAERIVIKDAAPVARDEKIVVKLLAPAERELLKPEDAAVEPPKPGIARDADGKLTWRFDLKPGEKRELPLRFSIEHPADLPVSGVE